MENNMSLNFKKLRKVNLKRCEQSFHPLHDWSGTDWACAVAGEVGEACNIIKKFKRGDYVTLSDLESEIADIIIYVDLLAAFYGIDLSECVKDKFNEVSDRVGSNIKL